MFQVGPTFFSSSSTASGDHPAGDGLTRFQTAFTDASSADISAFANGSGTNTGGTVGGGYYEVLVNTTTFKGLSYGTDTDVGRPANTAFTFEAFFQATHTGAYMNSIISMLGGTLMSTSGGAGAGTFGLSVNGLTEYLYYEDYFNGARSYTGSTVFPDPPSMHHFAIVFDATNTYSVYMDGVRILGPVASNDLAHTNGIFKLGGNRAGGSSELLMRYYGARIRRAVMYSGESFPPPAGPEDWGPP